MVRAAMSHTYEKFVSKWNVQGIVGWGTHSDQLILCTRSQVTSVRAEADAANVEIRGGVRRGMVLQNTNLLASLHIVDLSGSVAARGNVLAVVTEPHAADNAVVAERVDQVDVEDACDGRVENGVPVIALLLMVGWHRLQVNVEHVAGRRRCPVAHARVVGRVVAHLRRLRASGIGDGSVDLRSGGANSIGRTAGSSPARARRCCALGRLRAHAVRGGTWRVRLLVRRLLLARVRRHGKARRRPLSHLVLRTHLLFLRRGVLLGRGEAGLVATSHDAAEKVVSRGNGRRLLRGASVRRTRKT